MTVRMPFWMAVITAALLLLPIPTFCAEQAAGPPARQRPGPQVPSWFPLPKEHADYVEKILAHWENKSKDVQRYRCRFNRWEDHPNWVGDPKVPKVFCQRPHHICITRQREVSGGRVDAGGAAADARTGT